MHSTKIHNLHMQSGIGQFSSRLGNNLSDISQKSHQSNRKNYRLDLFKDIIIGLAVTSRSFQNLLQSFSTVFLFKLMNTTVIFASRSYLVLSFVCLSLNHALYIIDKDIAFWVFGRPNFKGDVVAEIFWQQKLGSHICVVSYCQTSGLPVSTLSIYGNTRSSWRLKSASIINLWPSGKRNHHH